VTPYVGLIARPATDGWCETCCALGREKLQGNAVRLKVSALRVCPNNSKTYRVAVHYMELRRFDRVSNLLCTKQLRRISKYIRHFRTDLYIDLQKPFNETPEYILGIRCLKLAAPLRLSSSWVKEMMDLIKDVFENRWYSVHIWGIYNS
jgi:hypothetical protein